MQIVEEQVFIFTAKKINCAHPNWLHSNFPCEHNLFPTGYASFADEVVLDACQIAGLCLPC